jgi:hypothetical protein
MTEKTLEQKDLGVENELRERLLELFETYQDSFDQHQWPLEVHRWYEFVRCILSAVEGRFDSQNNASSATRLLIEMGLLDIAALAGCYRNTSDEEHKQVRIDIHTVLRRCGFDSEQSERIVTALCAVALVVEERYQARIQELLRKQAIGVVENILELVPLDDAIGQESARLAVTHWLQNVLNLPILVNSPGLQALCKDMEVFPDDVLPQINWISMPLWWTRSSTGGSLHIPYNRTIYK